MKFIIIAALCTSAIVSSCVKEEAAPIPQIVKMNLSETVIIEDYTASFSFESVQSEYFIEDEN